MSDAAQQLVGRVLEDSHAAAWYLGRSRFGYAGTPPSPRGMLIGEAPGPSSDARLPLFPSPNSAGARLMKYADVAPADWMGKLVRMNLCDGSWSARRAVAGRARALAFLLDETNFRDGAPLRVLLLGARVARAWACYGAFGYEQMIHYVGMPKSVTIQVAWIPHPSGRNLVYNDRRNQLRARRAVLWAIGERSSP